MAYEAGTITSATPANDLRLRIEALFDTHTNWTFIESVTSGAITYYVWRNHGTGVTDNNSFGQDFYIALRVDTALPLELRVMAFEAYDSSTDLVSRPVTGATSSRAIAADKSNGFAATYALTNTTDIVQVWPNMQAGPGVNEYWITVTKNAVLCGVKQGTSDSGFYVGLFEALHADANEFPLCVIGHVATFDNISSSSALGGASRHPKKATGNTDTANFQYSIVSYQSQGGTILAPDLAAGGAVGCRVMFTPSTVNHQMYGRTRGLLRDVVMFDTSGATPRVGDTITVDSQVHWMVKLANQNVWVNRDAV